MAVDPESAAVVVLFSVPVDERPPDPNVTPPSSRGADGATVVPAGFSPEHAPLITQRVSAAAMAERRMMLGMVKLRATEGILRRQEDAREG
jgi:hypothetical protein